MEFLSDGNVELPYAGNWDQKESHISEEVCWRKSDKEIGRCDTVPPFRCSIPEVIDRRTLEDGSGLEGDEPEKEIPVDDLACDFYRFDGEDAHVE